MYTKLFLISKGISSEFHLVYELDYSHMKLQRFNILGHIEIAPI